MAAAELRARELEEGADAAAKRLAELQVRRGAEPGASVHPARYVGTRSERPGALAHDGLWHDAQEELEASSRAAQRAQEELREKQGLELQRLALEASLAQVGGAGARGPLVCGLQQVQRVLALCLLMKRVGGIVCGLTAWRARCRACRSATRRPCPRCVARWRSARRRWRARRRPCRAWLRSWARRASRRRSCSPASLPWKPWKVGRAARRAADVTRRPGQRQCCHRDHKT
jgi:hypothetical protein